MAEDWFRNVDWNADIAIRFEQKLGRARRKEQYLRIQACTLASTHPTVALDLLDRYFAMPNALDHAQGYVDRATALKALGRIDEAVEAYEAALRREAEFPNLRTQAYLERPILIAIERLQSKYDEAVRVLDQNAERLLYPVEHFLWNAARALIVAAGGDTMRAASYAKSALQAASRSDSGFRDHPTLGLVTDKHDGLLRQLAALGAA